MEKDLSAITSEFLVSILPENARKFKEWKVMNGSEVGVNYSTEIILIKVTYEEDKKPLNLVIKIPPVHSLRQHFLAKLNLFPKEIFIFETLIPEFGKLGTKCVANGKPPVVLTTAPFVAARFSTEPNVNDPMAILCATEDIRPRGFIRVDDYDGLDYYHCKLLIRETAKLHALGWALKKQKGISSLEDCYPLVEDLFFKEVHKDDLQAVLSSNYELARNLILESCGKDSMEFKGIDNFTRELGALMSKYNNSRGLNEKEMENILVKPPQTTDNFIEDSWIVACHGDLKTNNVLYKYDRKTSKPVEVALFDFQFYRECCSTIDLAFLLYSSTDHIFRHTYLDEMLTVYHDSFIEFCGALETVPFPGFSVNALKRKFHRSKPFGLLAAIIVLPMVIEKHGESMLKKDIGENGVWSEFLTSNTRADEDLKVLRYRFSGLATELCEQGVI